MAIEFMETFAISNKFTPSGDQPRAIDALTRGVRAGQKCQTLLGVTGSGKTFTIANVIQNVQKPTLVIAPNKTLAAQLVQEFRFFFPKSAVEYFVSYYDYYQPEAYVPTTDTYIEKEVEINEEIDRLRHAATASVLTRRDTIIVASVSCIYGLGSPEFYKEGMIELVVGQPFDRHALTKQLVDLRYGRSPQLARGHFRLIGMTLEIIMAGRDVATRIETRDGRIARIFDYDTLTGECHDDRSRVLIYPAKHFVVPGPVVEGALHAIEGELQERLAYFRAQQHLLEAERLERRTRQDIEMIREIGYCNGIENYARFFTNRATGEAPYTLMDYFPGDFLLVIDESHVTIPQLGAMYNGDRARKKNLVDNGFRLPSAYDNRPLTFAEFEQRMLQTIFTSATPGAYERTHAKHTVEQIIRPTGLTDPALSVRPVRDQVKDLLAEIDATVQRGERVLVTTLTKKMAENLTAYVKERDVKAQYLHSSVETLERIKILEDLRRGIIDVIVGVNLLREGLDLPEVSLVAILDADKEGFLRSETSLIQTIGRAARNVSGRVILYADVMTGSLRRAMEETNRRRVLQVAYNKKHNITPQTIKKKIASIVDHDLAPVVPKEFIELEKMEDLVGYIALREEEMKDAAKKMEFERAAIIRDEIKELRKLRVK